jgi:PAS domain S-box-containing protein
LSQAGPRWLSRLPPTGRYGVAFLAVSAATALIVTSQRDVESAPASLLFCAVMLSAWLGGLRVGLLATALSVLAFGYFLTMPDYSLAAHRGSVPRLLVFTLAALFVCSLAAAQKRATQSLSKARDELAGKVGELQKANRALQVENAERRRAEALLQESERRFRALIEHSSDAILMIDREATIRYASPSFERVLGYAPEEAVGRNRLFFIDPDQHDDAAASFAGLPKEPGQFATLQNRMRHKDGSLRWLETTVTSWLDEPAVQAVVANVRDITERKLAEQALRESEQRFRDHAETASDFLWETGADHHFTYITGSFHASGFVLARLTDARCWDLMADRAEEADKWREHVAAIEAHVPFRGFVYRTIRADGSEAYVSTSGRPIFDADGAFQGYRGAASDVTTAVRARQAEEALQRAWAELAHISRLTTLGEITASIAHEVNQPLAAVVANASAGRRWLAVQPPNLQETRDALDRIVRDGNRAGDIINHIRALLKKSTAPRQRLSINEITLEVIALTRSELDMNRVALELQLADDLPLVTGDRVQLQQVILNLIVNAIEAMRDQGAGLRELLVSTSADAFHHVRVTVQDSGPGPDPAGIDRLFDAFYTTKEDGMGMGLAISRSIVEAHGGRLWAMPNAPRGAIFHFTLRAEGNEEVFRAALAS